MFEQWYLDATYCFFDIERDRIEFLRCRTAVQLRRVEPDPRVDYHPADRDFRDFSDGRIDDGIACAHRNSVGDFRV